MFLSIAAVAFSVALLMVVDSLFTGFIAAIRKSYVAEAGDILLWSARSIPKYDVLIDKLEKLDGVVAAAPVLFGAGLLRLDNGNVREVMIQAIEPQREKRFTDWKESLLRQHVVTGPLNFEVPAYPDDDGAWLGIKIVAEPNEKTDEYDRQKVRDLIGKQVILTISGQVKAESESTDSAEGEIVRWKPKRKVLELRISDVAFTKTFYGDETLYLPFEEFNKLEYGDEEAGHARNIKIKLRDNVTAESMRDAISRVFEEFVVADLGWSAEAAGQVKVLMVENDLSREYFAELHKQMAVLLLIFGVICSVVILLIFCIFYMIVMTKQKDIAVIKSCGATSGTVALIFVGFGACVGAVGSGFGIFFGYVVTKNINILEQWVRLVFGLKLWRSSSYILNVIPNQVNWPAMWPIAAAAVAGCAIGALIPAIVAAGVEPVKLLRYE